MPGRADLIDGFSPASIKGACAAIGMSDGSTRILVDTAAAIAGSPRLRDAAIRCAELVFDSGLPIEEAIADWPVGAGRTGLPPFFDPTVLLAGFRHLVADHRRRGIPSEVTLATLRDLDLWMDHHRATTGAWAVRETGWLARHFTSRVFQLGRLQFETHVLELPFAVFISRRGAAAAILAEGGRIFREDGQFADADGGSGAIGSAATHATWTSRFVEDEHGWRGSAVDPGGRVRRAPMALDSNAWYPAARRGDAVLAVHIPATGRFNGPLTREACADSFRRAIPFFAKHLPVFRPRLLTCTSWMLDPQLALCLPSDSNLVSFQRFFRLLPVPVADDRQTLERVFGGPVADWSKAPRDTSLRRIMAEHAEAGLRWRMGAGVMLLEDAVRLDRDRDNRRGPAEGT
ncbi:MAG: acyltransferase domain-containing protein [Spirochaetes bacterium]|nr:acyltransferase domain-containing protein [Spirochaetota bacterium]